MKTAIIVMAVTVFNLYLAAGGAGEGSPAGNNGYLDVPATTPHPGAAGTMAVRAAGNGYAARLRSASDTGSYRPSLASLKESATGSRFTLSFSSFGCLRQYARLLRFEQTDNGVVVSMFESRPAGANLPEGKLLSSRVMRESDWNSWLDFERGLFETRNGGCTTSERYVLADAGGSVTVDDSSCQWFGFNTLVAALFSEPESGMRVIAG